MHSSVLIPLFPFSNPTNLTVTKNHSFFHIAVLCHQQGICFVCAQVHYPFIRYPFQHECNNSEVVPT